MIPSGITWWIRIILFHYQPCYLYHGTDNCKKNSRKTLKKTYRKSTDFHYSLITKFQTKSKPTFSLNAYTHIAQNSHDDVIKWKHFPRYWPFVRWIHRSAVNAPHKGQWHGALMFPLICTRINGWVNNGEAGDMRRYGAHYDVTVMKSCHWACTIFSMLLKLKSDIPASSITL